MTVTGGCRLKPPGDNELKIAQRAIKLTIYVSVDKRARSLYGIHRPDFKVYAVGSGVQSDVFFSLLFISLPPRSNPPGAEKPTAIDI